MTLDVYEVRRFFFTLIKLYLNLKGQSFHLYCYSMYTVQFCHKTNRFQDFNDNVLQLLNFTGMAADEDEDHVTLQMWHPHYSNIRSHSPASSIRVASHASRSNFTNLPSKLDQIRKKKMEKMEALKQLYLNKSENIDGKKKCGLLYFFTNLTGLHFKK